MIPTRLTEPPHDQDTNWSQTLYDGAPGLALLHAEQAHTTGDPATLHPWVRAMTSRPLDAHQNTGLYQGAPAVALALRAALLPGHPSHDAYRRAVAELDTRITDLIHARLAQARDRQARGELPHMREFDLIQGLTGLGAYLLHRDPADPLLLEVVAYLVTLTRPITVDSVTLPGWWTPTAPTGRVDAKFPGGYGNFGLAHGIAGPLALLALTHRHGVTVPGHVEAIATVLDWYDDHRVDHHRGPWWPATITDPAPTAPPDYEYPGRPSWCYGTPGIARAHQLAALALGDRARATAAENAIAACLSDHNQLAQLNDLTICHGLAGAVLTAWRAATDADPGSPLAAVVPGLRDLLSDSVAAHPPGDAGLLDGLAGVALTLHTTNRAEPPPSRWDHCLLIAG